MVKNHVGHKMARGCVPLVFVAVGSCIVGAACVGTAGDGMPPGAGGSAGVPPTVGTVDRLPDGATLASPAFAASSGVRRLTRREFDATLRDLVGDSRGIGSSQLPDDTRSPFDNDYSQQVPGESLIRALDSIAANVADWVIVNAKTVIGCTPPGPGNAQCFRDFVSRFGQRALRRPLSAAEVTNYTTSFWPVASAAGGDFDTAIRLVIRVLLQHPEFVYRVEVGVPVAGQAGLFKLTSWEVASRLSYALWGSMPDDALFNDATTKALETSAGVRQAAVRMLKDPRAQALVRAFHAFVFKIDTLGEAPGDGKDMFAESAALIKQVVFDKDLPWQDLFRSKQTFVSQKLAATYGLPGQGWVTYPLTTPLPRQGILSHAAFLSLAEKDDDTSVTGRGLQVRENLLCQPVHSPPPMPGINTNNLPPGDGCKGDNYRLHVQKGTTCQGCHRVLDPIGLGLENFDLAGKYRPTEKDKPTCQIQGAGEVSDIGIDGKFKGPAGLSDVLVKSGKLGACVVEQLYRFTTGKSSLDLRDKQMLDLFVKKIAPDNGDFKFQNVILEMLSTEAFLYRRVLAPQ